MVATIPIYIIDTQIEKTNELTGGKRDTRVLVNFTFNSTKLLGYWTDPTRDEYEIDTILFYLDAEPFRTPYKKETETFFNKILDENSHINTQ